MFKSLYLLLCIVLFTSACRKKPDTSVAAPVPSSTGLKFEFQNVVNGVPLALNGQWYISPHSDSFMVTEYKYYISNISLTTSEGTIYVEPESYHLVNEKADSLKSFIIKGLPEGNYTKMKFLIGVDSLRNVSGAQTGALDPAHGMFWDWDSGYIMAKLECTTPQDIFLYHIAGWKGPLNVLRWVTLEFPSSATVTKEKMPKISIQSDVAEWFKTPNTIKFDLASMNELKIADNYADMFKVVKVD